MGRPQPTDAHQRLARLAGDWAGVEKMLPSEWAPEGYEAPARRTARVALGGFAVVVDYEQEKEGRVVFSGHGMWALEPETREVVLHWLDSTGTGLETFRGGWDGDVLTLESRSPTGRFRLTYDLSAPDTMRTRMESSKDGGPWTPLMEGAYRRLAPAPGSGPG